MSSRTADDYFKTTAAQGFGDNCVRACAIEHQAVVDGIFPARRGKNVPHAAQIAFAFFADVANKQQWQRMAEAQGLQHGGDGQYRAERRLRCRNFRDRRGGCPAADVQGRACGKDRVQVGAQGDVTVSVAAVGAEDVANLVGVDRGQTELF